MDYRKKNNVLLEHGLSSGLWMQRDVVTGIARRGSRFQPLALAGILALAVLPSTTLAAGQSRLIRAPLGVDAGSPLPASLRSGDVEAPGRPPASPLQHATEEQLTRMADGHAELWGAMAQNVYRDELDRRRMANAEAKSFIEPRSLAEVAHTVVADAIERRAPKREASATHKAAETMLLAVSGRGSFHREREADLDLDKEVDVSASPAPGHPAKPAPAPAKGTATAKKSVHGQPKGTATGSEPATTEHATPKDSAAMPTKAVTHGKSNNATKEEHTGGMFMSVTAVQLIPVYCGIVPIVVVACVAFECIHKRWAAIDLNQPIPDLNRDSDAGQGLRVSQWLTGFGPLTRQFFVEGPMAGTAKMLLFILMFLAVWSLFMDWARNIWQRDFWDAIEAKHTNRFWKAMLLFVLMAIVNVLCSTYQGYAQSILAIRWRAQLTRNLQERWLMGRAYCVQHFPPTSEGVKPQLLDNPDQRIQEDVAGFISGAIAIFFGTFGCIGRLALFTPILFMLSPDYAFGYFYCPGWLLYVSLIYSGVGSMFTHFAGRWLIPLSFIKQQVEADFRHSAVQVRDNTESIALYGSEETEHNRLMGRFDVIQRVVWEQMRYGKHLGFFRNFYFLLNDIAPFCILAGNYFRGQITLGQMMQILGALGHVSDSLNAFVTAYTDIADLRATTDRLYGFFLACEKGSEFVKENTMSKEVSPPGDTAALYAQEVCVKFPAEDGKGDRILWNRAGLVVQPGERVLLLGPDGCGKSVYLRAIAGCWPATGSVRIGRGDALFVPQRPFVPAGQLREALAYPEPSSQYTDEEMLGALQAVNLRALDEVPLSEEADWQRRLSGGELQRLALAHALLRKPGLLVLDETTAAIGEDGTAELYATLAKLLPTSTAVISVDHDAILNVGSWHNVHYTIDTGTHTWIPSASQRR